MDWELATLQPDFIALFWSYYRTPEEQRNAAIILGAKQRCEAHFQKLDQHLKSNKYLAGSSFTMADITCATCLFRYFSMGINIRKPPEVVAWYERISAREAFRQSIMLPYNELKGRMQF